MTRTACQGLVRLRKDIVIITKISHNGNLFLDEGERYQTYVNIFYSQYNFIVELVICRLLIEFVIRQAIST